MMDILARNNSACLIPIVLAFLVFAARFYALENAASKTSPSFMLAMAMIGLLLAYMGLIVAASLFPFAALGFGIVGLLFLGLAIALFRS